jgi:hypothetical protein
MNTPSQPHEATHGHHDAHHGHHDMGSVNRMAVSATLHCLTGCAIGEIVGLIIGTALGFSNLATIGLAIALAFAFGYSLSTLPLLKPRSTDVMGCWVGRNDEMPCRGGRMRFL